MIYAIIIWTLLGLSTAWIIYESVHVKNLSLVYKSSNLKVADEMLNRSHAKLLFVLIILWWIAYLLVNVLHINQTVYAMDGTLTLIILAVLTPIFTYLVYYTKYHLSYLISHQYSSKTKSIGWTLNILTAFIYASLINYGIQMFLLF